MLKDLAYASIAFVLLISLVSASEHNQDYLTLYDSINSLRKDVSDRTTPEEVRSIVREEINNQEFGSQPVFPLLLYGLLGITLFSSIAGLLLGIKAVRNKSEPEQNSQEFESLIQYFQRNLQKTPSQLRRVAELGGWKKSQINQALEIARKR